MDAEGAVPPISRETSSVQVVTHPIAEMHDPGPGHPEQPARIKAVWDLLRTQDVVAITWHSAEPADRRDVEDVHSPDYLDLLAAMDRAGGGAIDPDTMMSRSSHEAAYRAAGAAIHVAELALQGKPAFAAVRPPGHHACRDHSMGFCLLNNVVVAARTMLARHGLERILIVDWDVHHGNGTQELVEADARIRYVSLHQHPHYPGTGRSEERGVGNIFNVPRPAGLPAARYVEDLMGGVAQAVDGWDAELLLISAGFDAMRGDPLGGFTLEPDDYGILTDRLKKAIGCPVASILEGGYTPARIAAGVMAHLAALGDST